MPKLIPSNRHKRSTEDFAEEIRSHLELEAEELKSEGMNPEDAQRQARRAFGNVTMAQERFYMRGRMVWLDALTRDLHFGSRSLAHNPGFTFTVILTLALSIGANTAIFSLVNAMLIRSLPYDKPGQLASIYLHVQGARAYSGGDGLDGEQWELLRDNVPSVIPAISSGMVSGVNLEAHTSTGNHVQYLEAERVSAHYFDVLAIKPLLGRNFTEEEDRPSGGRSVVLSYGLWHSVFNGDLSIVGQAISLKGEPYTVIGVLPDRITPLNADIYTALKPSRQGEGAGANFDGVVRLRDGATWQQANAEINRAWAPIAARFAQRSHGSQVSYYFVPLQKSSTEEIRPKLLVLMTAAGFILFIACANLAGLTLVRMMRRAAEMATRLALGASHWQILRQLWIENLLLAFVGGLISIAVGWLALQGLLTLLPEHYLPVSKVGLDLRVLAFTLFTSLGTSVLFGMLPALATRKIDLRSAIASRGSSTVHSIKLRQALIAGEIALTVVLLAASGLLIRTLVHLQTLPAGFNPHGVMAAKASLDDTRFAQPGAFHKLLATSIAAMRQIPGVQSAGMGLNLPYERPLNSTVTIRDGADAGKEFGSDVIYVTPGYFETLRVPLVAGRGFTESDSETTQKVAVVNQRFAQKFLHTQNPVGRYLNKNTLIVGMVADVVARPGFTPGAPVGSEETMYISAYQVDPELLSLVHGWFQPSWIVRTAQPIEGLTSQMQQAMASADSNLPFSGFFSMSEILADSLATQRIEVALLSAMAGLALLLSAIGIFSLVANMVAQRTREIGIRIALGSSIRNAMLHVARTGVLASVAGIIVGLILAAAALRLMRSVLFGVSVYDATTIATVIATLGTITLLATILPTLKIARINPAKTLREE